ncbi:MAG: DUF3696 domain-containing protein [Alphaproteobacteria bacterium]|nr:DUF3696 domain-containing protein [Alphaproteobacteria bacterium]
MLKSLHIENFKSWRSVELEFGKITAIFGTNSSGKSSLLQFLLLLKQTREATDGGTVLELNSKFVELGSFSDLIYCHDSELSLNWTLIFNASPIILHNSNRDQKLRHRIYRKTIEISCSVAIKDDYLLNNKLGYKFDDGAGFDILPLNEMNDNTEYKFEPNQKMIETNDKYIKEREVELKKTIGRLGSVDKLSERNTVPSPIKSYLFSVPFIYSYMPYSGLTFMDVVRSYELQFDSIYYIGPLRDYPKRDYPWSGSAPLEIGAKGEKTIDAILARKSNKKQNNQSINSPGITEEISASLNKLKLIENFTVDRIAQTSNRWQVTVKVKPDSPEVLLTEIGFGVSQILPVITQLFYAPKGSTVILEQPEIHLHPLAQAELADLLIQVAYKRDIQIIVESHSEHFLLRLQRRIAEQRFGEIQVKSDDIKLYFCDIIEGESQLIKLDLDEYGTIHNWPENFMGDAFGETAFAAKAAIKRRKADK